jgi:hypothetical protein
MIFASGQDLVFWADVSSAVATVGLLGVTFAYARSTAQMAKSAAASARWMKDTAEATLTQGILVAQPRLLPVSPLMVESASPSAFGVGDESSLKVPIALAVTLRNEGPGPALNSCPRLTMVGVEAAIQGALAEVSIPAGAEIEIKAEFDRSQVPDLVRAIQAATPGAGELKVTCRDSLGYTMTISWKLAPLASGGWSLSRRTVEYVGSPIPRGELPGMPSPPMWAGSSGEGRAMEA